MITTNTHKKAPEYGQYIASVDPYKITDEDSIGEVYIYKNSGTSTGDITLPSQTLPI